MIIRAKKTENGWVLVRPDGEQIPETAITPTRGEAYPLCERYWPKNSVWEGHKVKTGYRINCD